MQLTRFNKNVNYHQANPDRPNMSAEQLKKLFDQASLDIKEYINNTLLPELEEQTKNDLKARYHIGKVIIDTSNTNPYTYLGFGNWEYIGQGKTLVGVDTGDTDFSEVEKTGGNKTHTMTKEELPPINLQVWRGAGTVGWQGAQGFSDVDGVQTGTVQLGGNSKSMNILNPYVTVYFWKRTA